MKVTLFDFQEGALEELRVKLTVARALSSVDSPQAVSFSAPTGAGKTIVMTALFEDTFCGQPGVEAQSNASIHWILDMPELNEQARLKNEGQVGPNSGSAAGDRRRGFDGERLEGGRIYFVNTQKLGTEKLLTRTGDDRQYSIWESIASTW